MSQLLIDAGRSSRGWSRIGSFFRCPQLFAYQNRLDKQLIPADALTRGSMGHVLQAHQHAIWGARTAEGVWVDEAWHNDPSVFLPPEEAVHQWCDANGGHKHLDRMTETFRRYMAKHPEAPGSVVAVEYPITAVLGEKSGVWGLWVVHPEEQHFNRQVASVRAWDDDIITLTPLNCPGHPDSGSAIVLTRRLDMVTKDRAGRIFVWDHKHQAKVEPNRSVDGYAIDGGFAAFRIMGKQLYGKHFGGVALNLIQTQEPWRVARPMVPATPHRDRHFADMLWRAEHTLARLDLELPNYWDWPKVQHETTCVGRYGACAAIKMCFYGEAVTN
jgi:hypothetical protein